MRENKDSIGVVGQLVISVRIVIFTMLVCCGVYTLFVYAVGQAVSPHTAEGSLITDAQGKVIGSELIAQKFTRPGYFWPRPSASDYNAAGSAGSNLSPTNPKLKERALGIIAAMGTTPGNPVPADLVTASGSGLDPNITVEAAMYQAKRVADARGLTEKEVKGFIESHASRTGGMLTPEPLVNVLLLNIDLDRKAK